MAEEEKKHESETPPSTPEPAPQAPEAPATPPAPAAPPVADVPDEVDKSTEPQLITSEKVEIAQAAKIEKKPGLFKRLFKRKQKEPKTDGKVESPASEKPPLSQQEMSAKLAQLIDKQIAENSSGEFLVLRIRKQYFLLLAGVAILAMWLVALGKPDITVLKSWLAPIIPKQNASQVTPEGSPSAEVTPQKLKVRIRYVESQQAQVEAITTALIALNLEVVDAVVDPTLTEVGYQFITKPEHESVVASISAALSETYSVASSSSQLSADSDFDGVFIVGKLD